MFKKRVLSGRGVAGLALVWVCGFQLAACSAKKDALVIFDVKTAADVPAFTQFRFSAPDNVAVPTEYTPETAANRFEFMLGYYMPVSGSVTVLGEALTADKCVVGHGMATASGLVLGQITTAPATLSITAVTTTLCLADSGVGGGGGATGEDAGGGDRPVGGTGGGGGGTGGALGSGGSVGTGGAGTDGGGAGGMIAGCQGTATQCSGNGVQTCDNGQWGPAVGCGPRQTCAEANGVAACACNKDPVCSSIGNTCANPSTLGVCMQDAQACFFESSSSTCTNGACGGAAGAASCCTNACTSAATLCLSETMLQTCSVGVDGCTALNTAACSTGFICERYAPAGCADPSWAEWPMPNSSAEVAAGAPNVEAYTDNGNGTVTDNVTGLMWQQNLASGGPYTWAQAVAYCPTLSLGGHSDWRLPAVIELVSLLDYGKAQPTINTTAFPSPNSAFFWSSSPLAGSTSSAWGVDLFGGIATNPTSGMNNVHCVR